MILDPVLATVSLSGSVGVGLIFLTAAISKLQNRALLPGVVANYRILPEGMVESVAIGLPIVELGVGIAMIVGLSGIAPALCVGILWVFAAAMAINLNRGRSEIDCGCGRPQLRQTLSWTSVVRNLALSVLVLPRVFPVPPISTLDLFTAAAGGVSLYLLYLLLNSVGALTAVPVIATRR